MNRKKIIVLTLFAITMGFIEAAVVIYLRELYYPHGFNFPISPMPSSIIITEIGRELATLGMLMCVGYLSASTYIMRFASFIYAFAI